MVRDFYKDNFDIELYNYVRPDDWWINGLNLYEDNFAREGFRTIDVPFRDIRIGDCFLIAIPDPRTRITPTNHIAIYVGDGKVIHHLLGRLSCEVPYKGMLRNYTTCIIRHRHAGELNIPKESDMDMRQLILPAKRRLIDNVIKDSNKPTS